MDEWVARRVDDLTIDGEPILAAKAFPGGELAVGKAFRIIGICATLRAMSILIRSRAPARGFRAEAHFRASGASKSWEMLIFLFSLATL